MKTDKMEFEKFRGRKNKTLGSNELRQYLANKEDTARSSSAVHGLPENYIEWCEPVDYIKVLLLSLPLTIPIGMQKRCIPPLGISYIAAALEADGIDVEMFDCCVEGWETEKVRGDLLTYGVNPGDLCSRLQESKPDIVGISLLFSTDLPTLYDVAAVVRETLPKSTIVVGGLHPTIYPEEIFELDKKHNGKQTVDFVLRGEGEKRLVEFVNNLSRGQINKNADGLAGFIEGSMVCNNQIEVIEDLDTLPFPAYHLLPIEKYMEINVPFSPIPKGERVLPMLTTRGCPIGCTFCANTNTWTKHRKRSVENIVQEVKYLKDKFKIDELQFADDNLTFDMKHSIDKFEALKKLKVFWCTPNGTMINKLNERLIRVMASSGMYQITLSMDSAVARTLRELHHKPVNLDSIPGLINYCRGLGVYSHGTLVVGMPGETLEEIKDGFDYVKRDLEFTSISVFIAAAVPGSELYHEMLDQGKIEREDAREIDTTKAKIALSNIKAPELESLITEFQADYFELVKQRHPREYEEKYGKLLSSGKWDESISSGKFT